MTTGDVVYLNMLVAMMAVAVITCVHVYCISLSAFQGPLKKLLGRRAGGKPCFQNAPFDYLGFHKVSKFSSKVAPFGMEPSVPAEKGTVVASGSGPDCLRKGGSLTFSGKRQKL